MVSSGTNEPLEAGRSGEAAGAAIDVATVQGRRERGI